MIVRQWRCRKKIGGYLLELKYGPYEVCRFVDIYELRKSLDENAYICYHLIQMNMELVKEVFPMTTHLDNSCKYFDKF